MFNSGIAFAQFDISLGVSAYNGSNSNFGFNAGASIRKFYLDFSSNLKGASSELEQYYDPGTRSENHLIVIFNAGYNFHVKKNWYLIPEIGFGSRSDIYVRHNNRYSYENPRYFLNLGIASRFFISKDIGFLIGCGYPELGKVALIYKLWDRTDKIK